MSAAIRRSVGEAKRIVVKVGSSSLTDAHGRTYVKTDQLDGETDWKLRNPVNCTQKELSRNIKNITSISGFVKCEGPSKEIYNFTGVFVNENDRSNEEALCLDNTLWASTVLCSSRAVVLVVYVGRDTRIAMNITEGKIKVGALDEELNYLSKVLFAMMCIIALLLTLGAGVYNNFAASVIKYVLLLSSIIPISLRLNLDFSKIVFTSKINQDKDIEAVARNSMIPEELGRVSYIFSDKTGTLTQNEMLFKYLVGKDYSMSDQDFESFKRSLKQPATGGAGVDDRARKTAKKKEFILGLALCHNVTPVDEDGKRILQASSPDEIALVRAAESFGLRIQSRN